MLLVIAVGRGHKVSAGVLNTDLGSIETTLATQNAIAVALCQSFQYVC